MSWVPPEDWYLKKMIAGLCPECGCPKVNHPPVKFRPGCLFISSNNVNVHAIPVFMDDLMPELFEILGMKK